MQYCQVRIDNFAYQLPDIVVSTEELEDAIKPVYEKLRVPLGQLKSLTGIEERRWWPRGFKVADGAAMAAQKAIQASGLNAKDIDLLIYAGVCRDYIEPATACSVAHSIGLRPEAIVYDVSNACLGVLNGMIDCANRIELSQIRHGLIVACESARDINEETIFKLNRDPNMPELTRSLATLTGGSGAAAVLLSHKDYVARPEVLRRRLLGGAHQSDVSHHQLCRWGFKKKESSRLFEQFMITDAVGVMKHGLSLARDTWTKLLCELHWNREFIGKVISHQVGSVHRRSVLGALGLKEQQDFATFPSLGNMGTVSVPLTAAIAAEKGFLLQGDAVGLLGIGSGLNCLMLGVDW